MLLPVGLAAPKAILRALMAAPALTLPALTAVPAFMLRALTAAPAVPAFMLRVPAVRQPRLASLSATVSAIRAGPAIRVMTNRCRHGRTGTTRRQTATRTHRRLDRAGRAATPSGPRRAGVGGGSSLRAHW
jgi:hypothetical protein